MEKFSDIKTTIEKINRVSIPRPLRLKNLGSVILIIIIVSLFFLFGVAAWTSKYGISTTAKIVNKRMVWASKRRCYIPEYDLVFIAYGMHIQIYQPTNQDYFDSKKEGDLVPIHYFPIIPWLVYPDEEKPNVIFIFYLCSGFTLFFGFIFNSIIMGPRKLLSLGKAVEGTVASVKNSFIPLTNPYISIINYNDGSKEYSKKMKSKYQIWNVGDKCIILFDQNNPTFSCAFDPNNILTWWEIAED